MIAWKNIRHASYHGRHDHYCLSCGNPCARSSWGPWCFLCNFERMSRLSRKFDGLAKSLLEPSDPDAAAIETRRRMVVAAAAYAYEVDDAPFITDDQFDRLARSIDLTVDTHRPRLDAWFRAEFSPHTGSWVHDHPDLDGVRKILDRIRSGVMKIDGVMRDAESMETG